MKKIILFSLSFIFLFGCPPIEEVEIPEALMPLLGNWHYGVDKGDYTSNGWLVFSTFKSVTISGTPYNVLYGSFYEGSWKSVCMGILTENYNNAYFDSSEYEYFVLENELTDNTIRYVTEYCFNFVDEKHIEGVRRWCCFFGEIVDFEDFVGVKRENAP